MTFTLLFDSLSSVGSAFDIIGEENHTTASNCSSGFILAELQKHLLSEFEVLAAALKRQYYYNSARRTVRNLRYSSAVLLNRTTVKARSIIPIKQTVAIDSPLARSPPPKAVLTKDIMINNYHTQHRGLMMSTKLNQATSDNEVKIIQGDCCIIGERD